MEFAQDNISSVNKLQLEEVRDHIKQMLERIVESMETSETDAQQEKKSKGNKDMSSAERKAANPAKNSDALLQRPFFQFLQYCRFITLANGQSFAGYL